MPSEPPRMPDRRRLLWWAFWFVFLTTPVCAIFLPSALRMLPVPAPFRMAPLLTCIATAIGGAFAAGFILARLVGKSDAEFVRLGIGYGFAISTVYVIMGFAGCFVIMATG